MKTTTKYADNDRTEETSREAIRAIRECLNALALTGRINRYTDPTERLHFIRTARAYYQQQIDDGKEDGVSQCLDTLVPRLGDLTDYFRSHEKQAEAELQEEEKRAQLATKTKTAPNPQSLPPNWGKGGGTNGQSPTKTKRAKGATKRSCGATKTKRAKSATKTKTKTKTPKTQIHMTFYNYGSAQVFESGSNPTINIEQFGGDAAPQQVSLPEEEGTSTPAELAATLNNRKQPGPEEIEEKAPEELDGRPGRLLGAERLMGSGGACWAAERLEGEGRGGEKRTEAASGCAPLRPRAQGNENQAQSAEGEKPAIPEIPDRCAIPGQGAGQHGGQKPLCAYIIPNDIKPMEEVEREMAAAARVNGACGNENKLSTNYPTTRPDGVKAQEEQTRRFPYFSREATEKDRREFEDRLHDAAPRGNRYIVETFNSYAFYLDLRGIHTTDIHRELAEHWGLKTKRSSFAEAMINCRCLR